MTPHTPDDGGDATPMATPILVCPECGAPIPPIAMPVPKLKALKRREPETTTPFPREETPPGQLETRIMRHERPGEDGCLHADSDA
jgi:hypothetical protein